MSNPFDKRSERQIGYEMELVRKQIAMDNLKYENSKYIRKRDNYYDQSSESCDKLGNWCCLILIVCFFRIILNPKPPI